MQQASKTGWHCWLSTKPAAGDGLLMDWTRHGGPTKNPHPLLPAGAFSQWREDACCIVLPPLPIAHVVCAGRAAGLGVGVGRGHYVIKGFMVGN